MPNTRPTGAASPSPQPVRNEEIWSCGSDGTHCFQVTAFNGTFVTGTPRWSPDGKQIVFDSAAAGTIDIYAIDASGGSPRRLTGDQTHGMIPSWSRDGKWIYFASAVTGRNEIWKIPSDGGNAVQVTRNGGLVAFESRPGRRSTTPGTMEIRGFSGVRWTEAARRKS
jgi:tricorn protease-like protein